MAPGHYDALVIGAGAGGLGAALTLAESGARVLVCETLTYPGGCAATFRRRGFQFDAGATLSAGLGEDQTLGRWIRRHQLPVDIEPLDPVLELRAPGLHLDIPSDRALFLDRLCALEGVPESQTRRFFAFQQRVADALWHVIDRPHLLPPLDLRATCAHAARLPKLLPLLGLVGRPLLAVLHRFGLAGCRPVRTLIDALCQITVQCTSEEAETLFALGALDYLFRGTGHIRGGIGQLSSALVTGIRGLGGEVRFASRVKSLVRSERGWTANVRGDSVHAHQVIANVLPGALSGLGVDPPRRVSRRAERVKTGWGACMLYLGLDADADLAPRAHHMELVRQPGAPLAGGNHLLVSLGDPRDERAPEGQRVATVSTHIDPRHLTSSPDLAVGRVQAAMRRTLAELAPEVSQAIRTEMPASPRTFQRFTRRASGLVGGIPRRVGLDQYLDLLPRAVRPGLWLVGDSVMLGQSVLAAATGGARVATAALRA